MSPRKKKIIIALVAVVIAFIIGIILYRWLAHNGSTNGSAGSGSTAGSGAAVVTPTRAAVPAGSTAPNQGATAAPAGVAVPTIQGPGDPAGNVDYRSFNIAIQSGAFSPSTVIVNQGDTVDLEVTAVDGNYTFTQPDYGFNAGINKGKTQRIQFQALQSGDFTFYCSSCGGPSSGPVGHIIVVPTTQ